MLRERVEKLLQPNGQPRIPNWIVMVFNSGHNHKIQSWLQKLLGMYVPHGTMNGLRQYRSRNSRSSDPIKLQKVIPYVWLVFVHKVRFVSISWEILV